MRHEEVSRAVQDQCQHFLLEPHVVGFSLRFLECGGYALLLMLEKSNIHLPKHVIVFVGKQICKLNIRTKIIG